MDANMPLLFSSSFEAIVGLGPFPPGMKLMKEGADNSQAYAALLKEMRVNRYSVCMGRHRLSPGFLTWNDDAHERLPSFFQEIPLTNGEGHWLAELRDVKIGDLELGCQDKKC